MQHKTLKDKVSLLLDSFYINVIIGNNIGPTFNSPFMEVETTNKNIQLIINIEKLYI